MLRGLAFLSIVATRAKAIAKVRHMQTMFTFAVPAVVCPLSIVHTPSQPSPLLTTPWPFGQLLLLLRHPRLVKDIDIFFCSVALLLRTPYFVVVF